MITTFDMASGEYDVVLTEPVEKCVKPDLLQDQSMMRIVPRLMTLAEAVEMERRQRS